MILAFSRKVRSFVALPLLTKLLLIPVYLLLGLSRLTVLIIPFRLIAARLGESAGTAAFIPLLSPNQERRALLIGRTIRLAAKYTPWDANCFAQAIVARITLGFFNLPHTIFFGLSCEAGDNGSLIAHAWTAAGRISVTGGYGFNRFTVVGTFKV